MKPSQIVSLGEGATLSLYEDVIAPSPQQIKDLRDLLSEEDRKTFQLYGKPCTMRRKQKMFGTKSYKFSGIEFPPHEGNLPTLIALCMSKAKELRPGINPDAALAILYEVNDYISAHRDNEHKHRRGAPIIGFSFGETRSLTVKRHKRKRGEEGYMKVNLELPPGSAYVMEGERFQSDFTHEVGKGKKGERLSVTVREFV